MSTTATITNTPSTPKRRQAAIEVIEHNETFTMPEQVKVWNLFYKDIAAADSYMAITDERKRNLFVPGTSQHVDHRQFRQPVPLI